jgi:hypothetical protein
MLPNSFCGASLTMILKPDRDIIRKVQKKILDKYKCKNPSQNINKMNAPTI